MRPTMPAEIVNVDENDAPPLVLRKMVLPPLARQMVVDRHPTAWLSASGAASVVISVQLTPSSMDRATAPALSMPIHVLVVTGASACRPMLTPNAGGSTHENDAALLVERHTN